MTDNWTPDALTDDRLASFCAAGPPSGGFVKPDLVGPGGHLPGLMPKGCAIIKTPPGFATPVKSYATMSATSQQGASRSSSWNRDWAQADQGP